MAGYGDRFEIGQVISQVFGVIGRNAVLFFTLALVITGIPQALLQFFVLLGLPEKLRTGSISPFNYFFGIIGVTFGLAILGALLNGVLTRATIEDLSDRKSSFGECLATGLSSLIPLLIVSFLVTLGGFAGALLLVVPGVILWLGWSISIPVLIQERPGVIASLQRSWELTRGNRANLFALYLVLGLGAGAFQFVTTMIVGMFGSNPLVSAPLTGLISAIVSAVYATTAGVSYVELRAIKEGTEVEELATMFA